MKIIPMTTFLKENEPWKTFYVAFLKGVHGAWFPFCVISPEGSGELDTLCISRSYSILDGMIKSCVEKIDGVQQYLVHFMYGEEVNNLMERYGLSYVGYLEEGKEGCSCGCGCY